MRLLAPLLLLAGCSGDDGNRTIEAPDLETAAIARGVIEPADRVTLAGLYARESDRICVVEDGQQRRIGVSVDYGDGLICTGRGTVRAQDTSAAIDLGDGCTFDATLDGRRLRFPGSLPAECLKLCRGRASMAGLEVERLSAVPAEARAMRDARGRLLCAT
jgi:hypothetical protein